MPSGSERAADAIRFNNCRAVSGAETLHRVEGGAPGAFGALKADVIAAFAHTSLKDVETIGKGLGRGIPG